MDVFSQYDLIIKNAASDLHRERQKYQAEEMTPFFSFQDDVRILSAAGVISEVYLQVHNLSHYKNKRTDIEIGISIQTCIENLVFHDIEGGYFSLIEGDLA